MRLWSTIGIALITSLAGIAQSEGQNEVEALILGVLEPRTYERSMHEIVRRGPSVVPMVMRFLQPRPGDSPADLDRRVPLFDVLVALSDGSQGCYGWLLDQRPNRGMICSSPDQWQVAAWRALCEVAQHDAGLRRAARQDLLAESYRLPVLAEGCVGVQWPAWTEESLRRALTQQDLVLVAAALLFLQHHTEWRGELGAAVHSVSAARVTEAISQSSRSSVWYGHSLLGRAAARTAAAWFPDEPIAVQANVLLLRDPSALVRHEAARCLASSGQAIGVWLPHLVAACDDEYPGVVRDVILALGRSGADCALAVPTLRAIARADRQRLARHATSGIAALRRSSERQGAHLGAAHRLAMRYLLATDDERVSMRADVSASADPCVLADALPMLVAQYDEALVTDVLLALGDMRERGAPAARRLLAAAAYRPLRLDLVFAALDAMAPALVDHAEVLEAAELLVDVRPAYREAPLLLAKLVVPDDSVGALHAGLRHKNPHVRARAISFAHARDALPQETVTQLLAIVRAGCEGRPTPGKRVLAYSAWLEAARTVFARATTAEERAEAAGALLDSYAAEDRETALRALVNLPLAADTVARVAPFLRSSRDQLALSAIAVMARAEPRGSVAATLLELAAGEGSVAVAARSALARH